MDDIPHIAIPIAIRGAAYATNQQDTNSEVAACVAVVVGFPLGYREEAPEFGIVDPTFSDRPIDTSSIEAAVETYEPRATLSITEPPYDPTRPLATTVEVEVRVLATEDE
jgi:hypothetical protein